jgi:hypothetical protein
MSVGGRIIEMRPMRIFAGSYPDAREQDVVRIAVIDREDELCVYAAPADVMPKLGDEIWWQADKIYFDNDRRTLRKVAYSFSAPWSRPKKETNG